MSQEIVLSNCNTGIAAGDQSQFRAPKSAAIPGAPDGIGGAAAWSLTAAAQQPPLPVVGFVTARSAAASERAVAAFRKGLRETGYDYATVARSLRQRAIQSTHRRARAGARAPRGRVPWRS
jgi:hypothetical protein